MKIEFHVTSTGPGHPSQVVVLGDDSLGDYITESSPEGIAEVQTSGSIRAASKRRFARGNIEATIRFIVERALGSRGDSMTSGIDEVQEKLGLSGTLMILESDGSNRGLENAVIQSVRVQRFKGVTNIVEYTIVGSNFS